MVEVGARETCVEDIDDADSNQPSVIPVLKFASELVRSANERFVVVLKRRGVVRPVPPLGHVSMVGVEQGYVFVGNLRLRDVKFDALIPT